ncbi:MAG: hypothetical protein SNH13_04325 [Rikenellaceae bacterium]
MRHFLIFILSALTLTSCLQTDLEYNTELVISPYNQVTSSDEYVTLDGCIAYAFEPVDLEEWYIASYEDALSGRLTSLSTGESLEAFAKSENYASESVASSSISMRIDREEILILVINTQNTSYAYAYYEVGVNIATTYITVTFYEWYSGTYSSGDWVYNNPELIED